jgi:bacillithiol system protein YtxJ
LWKNIDDQVIIKDFIADNINQTYVIFKHSTRCSISIFVKARLDKHAENFPCDFYLLDLLKNRRLSNEIAEIFHVHHESPQVLLIKNGECVYSETHGEIEMNELLQQISQA